MFNTFRLFNRLKAIEHNGLEISVRRPDLLAERIHEYRGAELPDPDNLSADQSLPVHESHPLPYPRKIAFAGSNRLAQKLLNSPELIQRTGSELFIQFKYIHGGEMRVRQRIDLFVRKI